MSRSDWLARIVFARLIPGNQQLRIKKKDPSVLWLKRHPDASWWLDHGCDSPTYEQHVNDTISGFLTNNGSNK